MARNTFILVVVLAVFAAVVAAVNLTRPKQPSSSETNPNSQQARPTITSAPEIQEYTNKECGISFTYPNSLTLLNTPANSAIFSDSTNGESIVVLCQKEIPRPTIDSSKIDVSRLTSSVSAQLYHDASPKDGTPIDKFMFIHPRTKLTVYIAGSGPGFNQIIKTLQLLP